MCYWTDPRCANCAWWCYQQHQEKAWCGKRGSAGGRRPGGSRPCPTDYSIPPTYARMTVFRVMKDAGDWLTLEDIMERSYLRQAVCLKWLLALAAVGLVLVRGAGATREYALKAEEAEEADDAG